MNYIQIIVYTLILFILISCCLRSFYGNVITSGSLEDDGFYIVKDTLSDDEIQKIKNTKDIKEIKKHIMNSSKINQKIRDILGDDYIFQDYVWYIKKSKVHTCHRDNNGTFFNKGQKHDSYTIIFYLEPMDVNLDVIPGSHKNIHDIYLTDTTGSVSCNPGDAILFNANLVHTGTFTENEDNKRVQMKITHTDDIDVLNYYQNFNKILDKDNTHPTWLKKIQKHITCQFPIASDLTQSENIRGARGSEEAEIGYGQKIYSYLFYSDKDFYDLPNQ